MNRSFLYGIIVASSTWCFSLYLYWLLVQQQNSIPHSNSDGVIVEDNSKAIAKLQNINVNSLDEQKSHDQKYDKSFFEDKLQRYKKEQKFRKISQKLINELKPLENVPKDGK